MLVFYYIIAIALIIASVYLFVTAMLIYGLGDAETYVFSHQYASGQRQVVHFNFWWNPQVFLYVCAFVLVIVLTGSLYKVIQLARGGKVVAESLGGRLLTSDEGDPNIQKLLNVVEEMAIASGMPVPAVYLLEGEEGVNAFAAGFSQHDAVIGITRGCIELLNRDELQGVIAHEFSHILNGDMRLNIRLMGVVHGILLLALTGYWMMRLSGSTRSGTTYSYGSSSRNSKNKGGGIALMGLGLMIIGYIGVFFGKLIKSAVSREREYLADASAVQFTRNPVGIANALKKIGGFPTGSRLESSRAEEASHLFFSDGIKRFFDLGGLMATHPPLPERIIRLDPSFKGDYAELGRVSKAHLSESELRHGISNFAARAEHISAQVAEVTPQHVEYAQSLLSALPAEIKQRTRETYGARAIIYALLIDQDEKVQEKQFNELSLRGDKTVFQETLRIYKEVQSLPRKFHFPLVELSLPALSYLSKAQYVEFRENLENLMHADQRVNIFEYGIQKLVCKHLDVALGISKPGAKISSSSLEQVKEELATTLSCLAYVGHKDEQVAEAFSSAVSALDFSLSLKEKKDCRIREFDLALDKLMQLAPQAKKKLIEIYVLCVQHDGKITIQEAELLRLIADLLDCPLPPFVE